MQRTVVMLEEVKAFLKKSTAQKDCQKLLRDFKVAPHLYHATAQTL